MTSPHQTISHRAAVRCIAGALAAVLVVLFLGGCATVPRPRNLSSSMLVLVQERSRQERSDVAADIVVLKGPRRLVVDLSRADRGVRALDVPAGAYTVESRTIRFRGGRTRRFDSPDAAEAFVRPGAIVMAPWVFGPVKETGEVRHGGMRAPRPEDRRHAANALSIYVRTAEWAGRNIVGFAPYSPLRDFSVRRYRVDVESTPPGAEVVVDGEDWGKAPLPVRLEAGRHYFRIGLEGYRPKDAFVEVSSDTSRKFSLEASPGGQAIAQSKKLAVFMEPFENLGAAKDDYLVSVFRDSLSVALENSGVAILGGGEGAAASPNGNKKNARPDFAAAESAGARAFVWGSFETDGKTILIHAALYDTQTRLVKASVLFQGEASLGLFDSIDKMSARFSASVERALPEVGQPVVQERVLTAQEVQFATRLSEADIIRQRDRRGWSFFAGPYIGGLFDYIADPSQPGSTRSRTNGPQGGLLVGTDIPIADPLAFQLALGPSIFMDRSGAPKLDLPLYFGPEIFFHGYMSDIFLGLHGAIHVAQAGQVDFSSGLATVGPFFFFGLNLETGIRIYTYQKVTALPVFSGLALRLGLFGYRFNVDFSNPTLYPLEIGLSAIWGTRL